MRKKTKGISKRTIIGVFLTIIMAAALIAGSFLLAASDSGFETVKGFKSSCTKVLPSSDLKVYKMTAILKNMKKGSHQYVGSRVALEDVLIYRKIDDKTFVASSSGVGVMKNYGERIFTGKNAKKNYLTEIDKTGLDRFVIEGTSFKMRGLTEPGPYDEEQSYDIYGIYEGCKIIKDMNGTKAVLPEIEVVVLEKNK